jgi:hypothetical protein
MTILVIDGQGGKLGRSLVESVRENFPDIDIMAVGTNSAATTNMLKGGATKAATGENPVVVACRTADIIVGPMGIAIADSMMGEISPKMANAVARSNAFRVLIPMNMCDTYVAGVTMTTTMAVNDAMEKIRSIIGNTL